MTDDEVLQPAWDFLRNHLGDFLGSPGFLLTAVVLGIYLPGVVLYFLVGDFLSYWWHRIEHKNEWYATRVHRLHHADRPPLSIWTAMVVHPVEGASVFMFFHLYGIVFPIHLFTFAVAAFAMTAVNMITHCGYRLPIYDALFAHAAGHDLHHSNREPTNVSVVLTLCDRLFGTYQRASYRPAAQH